MTSISSLVHIASLTNQELFGAVAAAIKRSIRPKKPKKKGGGGGGGGGTKGDWMPVAIRVACLAARGTDGYGTPDDWVRQYNALLSGGGEEVVVAAASGAGSNFAEALRGLPARECYRKRLDNAFDALASSPSASADDVGVTVKQAAGLIRGSAFLASEGDVDGDGDDSGNNCEVQARALSQLIGIMPRLASLDPCHIFMVVQQPLLQKLHRDAFAKAGMKFPLLGAEVDFRHLLELDFSEGDESDKHSGEKRKRTPEETRDVLNETSSTIISHVLEAAHLAHNAAVRAKHGAVIYVPSEDGDAKPRVIGRGWNHDYIFEPASCHKNKIVLHSEVHAVVNAMMTHGEDKCIEELFPKATIVIAELHSDYAYDACHPCPKCHPMLRSVGISKVLHTTAHGKIEQLDLGQAYPELMSKDVVSIPLSAACEEQKFCCKRLQQAQAALNGMK